jgi:hypothetical protein
MLRLAQYTSDQLLIEERIEYEWHSLRRRGSLRTLREIFSHENTQKNTNWRLVTSSLGSLHTLRETQNKDPTRFGVGSGISNWYVVGPSFVMLSLSKRDKRSIT